jgi:glycine dehydrogenase subunit 2
LLHEAPHSTIVSRPDEVTAAKQPKLKWQPELVG